MDLISLGKLEVEIAMLKNQTAENIIEIGKRLNEAKKRVPHGEWGIWLKEKVQFSLAQANNFMRVAKEFPNSQALGNLGKTKVFALLEIPIEERTEFIENNQVKDMTTRELREAINRNKELIEENQKYKKQINDISNRAPQVIEREVVKEVEVLPDDYKQLKDSLKNMVNKDSYEHYLNETRKLNKENNRLKVQVEELKKLDNQEEFKKRLKGTATSFNFTCQTFLEKVGGMVWISDYLQEMDDFDKNIYIKTLDQVFGWVMALRQNQEEDYNVDKYKE